MKVVVFKGAFGQMVATTSEELVRKLTAAAAAITAAAAAREGEAVAFERLERMLPLAARSLVAAKRVRKGEACARDAAIGAALGQPCSSRPFLSIFHAITTPFMTKRIAFMAYLSSLTGMRRFTWDHFVPPRSKGGGP